MTPPNLHAPRRCSLPWLLTAALAACQSASDPAPRAGGSAGGKADGYCEPSALGNPGELATLFVALEDGGVVSLDASTGDILHHYATGPNSFGVAVTADGSRAFATDKNEGTLVEIDPASSQVIGSIEVGTTPQQPVLAPGGRIYISLSGEAAIAVVDVSAEMTLLKKIDTGAGTKPHVLSLSPDGKTLWATVQGKDPKVMSFALTASVESAPIEYRYDLVPRVVAASNTGAYFTAHHSTGFHHVNLADGNVSTPYIDQNGEFSEPRKQIEGAATLADDSLLGLTHEGRMALVLLTPGPEGLDVLADIGPLSSNPYWVTFDAAGRTAFVSIPGSAAVEAYDVSCPAEPIWRADVGGKAKRMIVSEPE